MALVAHLYHLPPRVLPSIQSVEGGAVGGISHNTNGTDDLGVMQVNTIWLPALSRLTRMPEPVLRDRLVSDACFNISASGAIMRYYLDETKGDLMRAVGNYHSHTPGRNIAYRRLVLRSATRLFGANGDAKR
jgi:hypothetical protein